MDKLDQIHPHHPLLKRGARLLAKACGGDEAAGSVVGRSGETVRRWGDRNFPETIPVFAVMQLEAECGEPIITRMLAQMSGHGLVPLDGLPAEDQIEAAHTDFLMAAAECSLEVITAKKDGKITPNEQAAITRRAMRVQERVGTLLKAAGSTPPASAPANGPLLFKKPGL